MGVFRIAKAEFIKIFKKPSVYIMGVILASVLVLSLLFFEPVGKQDFTVKLTGSTVGQVYDKFMNDSTSNYKKSEFDNLIDANLTKLDFYLLLNNRAQNLNKVNTEFSALFTDLKNSVAAKDPETTTNKIFNDVKAKLNEYKTIYSDVSTLTASSTFYTEYVKINLFTDVGEILDKIILDSKESTSSFISRITNNQYLDKLNKVADNDDNAIKNSLNEFAKQIKDQTVKYTHLVYNNPSPSYADQYEARLNELKAVVINAQTFTNTLFKNDYRLIFVEKAEYEELIKSFTSVISQLNSFSDPNNANANLTNHERHTIIAKSIDKTKLDEKLSTFSTNLSYYRVSTKTLEDLKKTINKNIAELKTGLTTSIETANKDASSADIKKIAALNDLITSYRVLANNTTLLIDTTLDLEATEKFGSTQITKFNEFDKFNYYETKENLSRAKYYIFNGVYNQHYSDVFSFNKNSTTETNAYDFMFYAMKIATVLISAFAILMAASLIASEYDSGTIKLLAMRPFRRWKIITGKLFATMFFVIVFVLFSAIISLVAGICLYPLSSAPVLAVLNGQVAFAINPALLMAIYICSTILEIFFYAVLALSISTIFRSYTAAISISFITFILAYSLNILFGGAFWYSFIPFINTDFFKYFGGSFLSTQTGLFNSLFAPTLLSNASIFITLGIYLGTISLLIILTHIIFKARDF